MIRYRMCLSIRRSLNRSCHNKLSRTILETNFQCGKLYDTFKLTLLIDRYPIPYHTPYPLRPRTSRFPNSYVYPTKTPSPFRSIGEIHPCRRMAKRRISLFARTESTELTRNRPIKRYDPRLRPSRFSPQRYSFFRYTSNVPRKRMRSFARSP